MKTGIIGAGIAGLTTSIALQKIGLNTVIYEAAPRIKPLGAGLVLAANAMKAFTKLGIADQVVAAGKALKAFHICDKKGNVITRTDSIASSKRFGLDNFTIHRPQLHEVLLANIDSKTLRTNKKALRIEQNRQHVTVHFEDGANEKFDQVIVADGIHSPIRQQLLAGSQPRYAGYTCWRAVIDQGHADSTAATETWGSKGRFGVVPLSEDKTYWFACVNAPQNSAEMKAYQVADLLRLFGNYHHPIPSILRATRNDQLIWNDICDLAPLKQYAFGNIVLMGDAAHATTPNMGQGACQAIEDAIILADEIGKHKNFAVAFSSFEQRRLARTHWIINKSYRIGQLAQLENKLLVGLRNQVFRLAPQSVNEKQLEKLYTVDF